MTDLEQHILVVDDEHIIAMGLSAQLEDMGLVVCGIAATAAEAIALAVQFRPRVILMDVRLRGEQDGVDAALAIHEQVGSRVIFITGSKDPSTLERIHFDHPYAILFKPISFRQLQTKVQAAMQD